MKKLVIGMLGIVTAVACYGQGTVNFNNSVVFSTSPTGQRPIFTSTELITRLSGTAYKAQLYFYPGAGIEESQLVTAGNTAGFSTSTSLLGFWLGSTRTLLNGTVGSPFGSGQATLQVRVWDSTGGLNYDQALAAGRLVGKTATFNYTLPAASTDPVGNFYMEGFRSFGLEAIPEPSTYALALLGLGGLLTLRRKK